MSVEIEKELKETMHTHVQQIRFSSSAWVWCIGASFVVTISWYMHIPCSI